MANPKPNIVEIRIYRGKKNYTNTVMGKVYGGIVTFKEADPTSPVIWLGQESYYVNNLKNKRMVLQYDVLSKSLFPWGTTEGDSVDMIAQTTQNVLLSGREAMNALGIQDANANVFKFALAMIVVLAILFAIFLYLFYTHMPVEPGSAAAVANKATTTISGLIPGGPQIVPKNS
jgi:hypothetical protein